jgi:hypothetical protein
MKRNYLYCKNCGDRHEAATDMLELLIEIREYLSTETPLDQLTENKIIKTIEENLKHSNEVEI